MTAILRLIPTNLFVHSRMLVCRKANSEAFKEAQGEADLVTKRDIDVLRHDIDSCFIQTEQRLVIKLGGLMALSIGVVAALIKLL